MKTYSIILIFCFGVFSSSAWAQEYISLEEALLKKKLEFKFCGNNSPHYLKPLKITIKNLGRKVAKIRIGAGMVFRSEPADDQDIVITKTMMVSLDPQKTKSYQIYAVCIQLDNSAPDRDTKYEIASDRDPNLTKLARFIDEKGFHGTSEAQHAMWAVSDQDPLTGIYGYHNKGATSQALIEFVAALLDKPVPSEKEFKKFYQVSDNGELFDTYTSTPRSEMSGKFFFQLPRTTKVLIGMFDDEGILVREIYHEAACSGGDHTIKYSFDSSNYQDQIYHFKLITNEQVWLTMTLDKNRHR